MTVFLLTECHLFDAYFTLASWSGRPGKKKICMPQNVIKGKLQDDEEQERFVLLLKSLIDSGQLKPRIVID